MYCNNTFNKKCWAVADPKLSGSQGGGGSRLPRDHCIVNKHLNNLTLCSPCILILIFSFLNQRMHFFIFVFLFNSPYLKKLLLCFHIPVIVNVKIALNSVTVL
jgi:hypothetical protein